MAIKYVSISDGVALVSTPHPRGEPLKRGRPMKEHAAQKAAAVEVVEIEIPKTTSGLTLKSKFDRAAWQKNYMREYMRKRRAADKAMREAAK